MIRKKISIVGSNGKKCIYEIVESDQENVKIRCCNKHAHPLHGTEDVIPRKLAEWLLDMNRFVRR